MMTMDMSQVIPYAAFGAISCFVWTIASYFGARNKVAKRLEEIQNPILRQPSLLNPEAKGSVSGILQKAAPTLSKALQPKTELEQNALRVRLANAGFNSPNAPAIYLALKVAVLVGALLLGGAIGLTTFGVTKNGLFTTIGVAAVAFYIPGVVLTFLKRGRQERIFLSLPDALDLLVVCVEAGLGLDAGMRRVAEELKDSAPELCSEFDIANFQLQVGKPRREVLHDLGVRSGVDDLRALAAVLIQADRFGSSVAQALRVQSDSMRVKRRQMAEDRAQQTAVKMIFPLVLFIFPGIFVVLVGPAAIMMMNQLLNR